jgi:7-carboxy-7-deazaguanine synthase
VAQVVERVRAYGVARVCVTGGEPLAQKGCAVLLRALCDAGCQVSLETSGALDIAPVDARVTRVVDLKTPGSGEMARNRLANLDLLRPTEQVKFVICDRRDFEWARDLVQQLQLPARCMVLFSPSAAQLPAVELAQWILEERLPVRLQIQLHKYLWGDVPGK